MGLNRVLMLVILLFAICQPSSQDITFLIERTKIYGAKSGNHNTVNIKGNGIDTVVVIEPTDNLAPVLIIPNGFILGDPRTDDVTSFTATAGSLVVIRSRKSCERWVRYGYGTERYHLLNEQNCQELIKHIIKYWDEFKNNGAVNKYNTYGVFYVIMTQDTQNGICLGSIRISGHGVDDTWSVPCSTVYSADVLFIPKGVIVWDFKFTYTNSYGQITTVKGDTCAQKEFIKYEKITSGNYLESRMSFKNKEVSRSDCNEFQDIVTYYFEHPPKDIHIKRLYYVTKNNLKFQVFSIEGNGIQDEVTIPEEIARDMQLLYIPEGFILGDWRGNRAFVYSGSLNTLVQITPDISVKTVYKAGKLIRTVPTDRGAHLKKMVNVWEKTGKKEFSNGFTVHRHSYEMYDGGCYMDIIIEGRKEQVKFTVPCVLGNNMETIFTDIGVIVGNYRRNLKSVFINNEGETVVIEDHKNCEQYLSIKGTPRIEDISSFDCQRTKGMIDRLTTRHKQGYLNALEKRNKEFHIFRERYLNKNEICEEKIHLSGNGIIEDVTAFCLITDTLDLIYLQEGFILGNFRKDPICVLAQNTGNLLVIKHKGAICQSKFYNELKLESTKPIKTEDCKLIETFVEEIWNAKEIKIYWTKKQSEGLMQGSIVDRQNKLLFEIVSNDHEKKNNTNVKIKGFGIEENISFDIQVDSTVVRIESGFILGNPEINYKFIYSSKANTLFVIQRVNYEWICTKWTYIGEKKVDNLIGEEECKDLILKVKNSWNDMINNPELAAKTKGITVVKRMSTTNNGCNGSLNVKGNGFNEVHCLDCSILESIDVLFTPNGVVIGEPSRDPVSFFSDNPYSLVVIRDGRCYRMKYNMPKSQKKSDSLSILGQVWSGSYMDKNPCSEIQKIMAEYMSTKMMID